MNWAIVFYAIFSTASGMQEEISWGLTFKHHEDCFSFYERNKQNIVMGINTHISNQYENAVLVELGCAHASADFVKKDQKPDITMRIPVEIGEPL